LFLVLFGDLEWGSRKRIAQTQLSEVALCLTTNWFSNFQKYNSVVQTNKQTNGSLLHLHHYIVVVLLFVSCIDDEKKTTIRHNPICNFDHKLLLSNSIAAAAAAQRSRRRRRRKRRSKRERRVLVQWRNLLRN
jgi:hypothetical protein